MTKLTHFAPNLFTNFFDDLATPGYIIRPLHGQPLDSNFKVDIKENKQGFNIKAQIPGVKKEDIHISVDGPMVTIDAEIKQLDEKKEDEKVVRNECYYGSISRSFQLPVEVDPTKTQAHYEKGELHIHLPKKPGNGQKKITVT
jgi:HSP20 family protein